MKLQEPYPSFFISCVQMKQINSPDDSSSYSSSHHSLRKGQICASMRMTSMPHSQSMCEKLQVEEGVQSLLAAFYSLQQGWMKSHLLDLNCNPAFNLLLQRKSSSGLLFQKLTHFKYLLWTCMKNVCIELWLFVRLLRIWSIIHASIVAFQPFPFQKTCFSVGKKFTMDLVSFKDILTSDTAHQLLSFLFAIFFSVFYLHSLVNYQHILFDSSFDLYIHVMDEAEIMLATGCHCTCISNDRWKGVVKLRVSVRVHVFVSVKMSIPWNGKSREISV